MKVRLFALTAVAALLSQCIQAQQLVNGATYVLRGTTQRYLSASENPPGALALSPHAAGWEQWRYAELANGARYLISYHGTVLVISAANGAASHLPLFPSTDLPGFAIQGYEAKQAVDGSTVGVALATAPLENGGVVITRAGGNGVWILADTANGLVTRPQRTAVIGTQTLPVSHFDEWWGIYRVPSPDMTRKPPQQAMVTGYYVVESAHRANMTMGVPIIRTSSADPERSEAIQTTEGSKPHTMLFIREGDAAANASSQMTWQSEALITYGARLCVEMRHTTDYKGVTRIFYLQQGSGTAGQFGLQRVFAGLGCQAWTILDPFGRHPAGDRIGSNDRVAIRNLDTGKQLSAEPGLAQLVLSPNSALWEQWLLRRSDYYRGY